MRVLVVEDEIKVKNFVQQGLEAAGMTVDTAVNADDMLGFLQSSNYDALVLDRLLERQDSVDNIAQIRKLQPKIKIIFLSALAEVEDKVRGLTQGADDYLGKPFHVAELVARLHAIVRRNQNEDNATTANQIIFDDLKIDLDSQTVTRHAKRVDVTAKEFRILTLLARHPGKIFSKAELLDRVWDMNHFPESNVVEVTVANLRGKLDKGVAPLIHSRRGQGYWLGNPAE